MKTNGLEAAAREIVASIGRSSFCGDTYESDVEEILRRHFVPASGHDAIVAALQAKIAQLEGVVQRKDRELDAFVLACGPIAQATFNEGPGIRLESVTLNPVEVGRVRAAFDSRKIG